MKNYPCSFEISAPAAAVYDALTTPQGLAGWRTKCDAAKQQLELRAGSVRLSP
jgi:uncharacterized protein YndB with AHSA1/START domain